MMDYFAKNAYQNHKVAHAYDDLRFVSWYGRIVDRLEKNEIRKGIATVVGNPAEQLIIDAPCGTGRISAELVRMGYKVVGIDISEEMLLESEVRHTLRRFPWFMGYVCVDLANLPFKTESVDAIASLRIMGHLPNEVKAAVLREFQRVTRTGAVIMFYLNNLLLHMKRVVMRIVGLKSKLSPWYPLEHKIILSLLTESEGFELAYYKDLIRYITESRVYVLHKNQ